MSPPHESMDKAAGAIVGIVVHTMAEVATDDCARLAAELREGGYAGRRMFSDACPLANRLTASARRFGDYRVSVGAAAAFVDRQADTPCGPCQLTVATIPLPPSLRQFAERFDRGEYPQLEEPRP